MRRAAITAGRTRTRAAAQCPRSAQRARTATPPAAERTASKQGAKPDEAHFSGSLPREAASTARPRESRAEPLSTIRDAFRPGPALDVKKTVQIFVILHRGRRIWRREWVARTPSVKKPARPNAAGKKEPRRRPGQEPWGGYPIRNRSAHGPLNRGDRAF